MSHSQEFISLSDLARSIKPGSRYLHFKGDEYTVIGVGKHTETLEEFVVYQLADQSDNVLCLRPLSMFIDLVDRDGYVGSRFTKIEEGSGKASRSELG